jgi:hypothetical protein
MSGSKPPDRQQAFDLQAAPKEPRQKQFAKSRDVA